MGGLSLGCVVSCCIAGDLSRLKEAVHESYV